MLKADLIRPRIQVRNGRVSPQLLPVDYHWLAVADCISGIFQEHIGRSRGILDEALREFEGDSLDYPIIRGLADVLSSRATFDREPPVNPAQLRGMLFTQGPAVGKKTLLQAKERPQLIQEAAERLNLSTSQVESALFADLVEEQILQDVGEPLTSGELIERYNLEVARGLLYWAKEVLLHVEDSYQDIFRYIKLGGLMHTIYPAQKGYDIILHGPISPFVKSTIRYGLQFARFMPALLLCRTWQMAAQVRPPGADQFLSYELDDRTELRGYFKGSEGFASKLEAGFATEFEEKYGRAERIWELAYEDEIIPVGDTAMIPDFSLTHRKDGRRALVEIVGFWHPKYLERKLRKIQQANRKDLVILVYESANVAEDAFEGASAGEVLMFKSKPVLKEVDRKSVV